MHHHLITFIFAEHPEPTLIVKNFPLSMVLAENTFAFRMLGTENLKDPSWTVTMEVHSEGDKKHLTIYTKAFLHLPPSPWALSPLVQF